MSNEREAFESWADDQGFPLRRLETSDGYLDLRTHGAWDAWQARAAAYTPMSEKEVRDLSAVVWGEPAGDNWVSHVGLPLVRAVEDCILRGVRPQAELKGEQQ
jgi:hypothetical protein